MDLINK